MSKKYTQAGRPLAVSVEGLDPNALLLTGFTGQEAISTLFQFKLDVLAENPVKFAFHDLLGKSVTVELELPGSKQPREKKRYFNGICNRVAQGERDDVFTRFQLTIVPRMWLLTKVSHSRIYQREPVIGLVGGLLSQQDIHSDFYTDSNPFKDVEQRDLIVQYRETDFNFFSRLAAEEGIYYYFKHGEGHDNGSPLVIVRYSPAGHFHLDPYVAQFRAKGGDGNAIRSLERVQELRAGRVTLRDHTFEKPEASLEGSWETQAEVVAGEVLHKLNQANAKLELYDYPGQYAKRFNGVNPSGVEQLDEVAKIYHDEDRTALLRAQMEASGAVAIFGESDCRHFTSGYQFAISSEQNSPEKRNQADGAYVLTSVQHSCALPGKYASGSNKGFYYKNTFTCIPAGLPFRPPRTAMKPVIAGTQTAVVVGPKGEEIFTDKYGRVKVKFFWDRHSERDIDVYHLNTDLDLSCWVRVGQSWAGKRFGTHFWPRVGQEVIVAFLEGDPDQPIVVGSVYNAANMPPYAHPKNKTRSGIKTCSTPDGLPEHYNEIRFEDKKGAEELYIQAERNLNVVVKASENRAVGGKYDVAVTGEAIVRAKDDVKIASAAKGLFGAKESVHIISSTDEVVISTGTAEAPTKFISVGPDGIALNVESTLLTLRDDGVWLSCGAALITIDKGGNISLNGKSVSINGAASAAPPAPVETVNGFAGFLTSLRNGKGGSPSIDLNPNPINFRPEPAGTQ